MAARRRDESADPLVQYLVEQTFAPQPVLNEPAIRAVVRMIEFDPDTWNQGALRTTTRMGSAHCLAAWTVILAGLDLDELLTSHPDGDIIYATAARLLGLTAQQAARLFLHVHNDDGQHITVDQLKERITAVTGIAFPAQAG